MLETDEKNQNPQQTIGDIRRNQMETLGMKNTVTEIRKFGVGSTAEWEQNKDSVNWKNWPPRSIFVCLHCDDSLVISVCLLNMHLRQCINYTRVI